METAKAIAPQNDRHSVAHGPGRQVPMLRRREFIATIGCATAAWPLAARAQQRMPVIGVLRADAPAGGADAIAAFRKGLSETGFVEGRNLAIEFRWGQNDRDRMPELAADLIRRRIDVIAAPGSAVGALAARGLTTTIPIVFSSAGDPVELGLVASLNRPGGNVTGFTTLFDEFMSKQLGFLNELLPGMGGFALLVSRSYAILDRIIKRAQMAAAAMGRQVEVVFAGTDREVEAAFAQFVEQRVRAIVVVNDVVLGGRRTQILTLAARNALPAIYSDRVWADAGGLMSYGPPRTDAPRQVGIYVGRILKGEKAADLPVVQAAKFEFVINLATARAIGIQVPPTLLAIADEVIE
jgi:putative ABC transport system substrate-binding protein